MLSNPGIRSKFTDVQDGNPLDPLGFLGGPLWIPWDPPDGTLLFEMMRNFGWDLWRPLGPKDP